MSADAAPPWIGRYHASRGLGGSPITGNYELELNADNSFKLTVNDDLKFAVIRGHWVLSSRVDASGNVRGNDKTFDYVTLVQEGQQEGPDGFGFIFSLPTFRVDQSGITSPLGIPTAAGWTRIGDRRATDGH